MSNRFYVKVRVPLHNDAGFVELEIDLPDLSGMASIPHTSTTVFGMLSTVLEYAQEFGRTRPPDPPALAAGQSHEQDVEPVAQEAEDEDEPTGTNEFETFKGRRIFTDEERFTAVTLAAARGTRGAAEQLGISVHTLTDWLAADRAMGSKPDARRCADEGCDTVLSIYNKGEWCAVHEREHLPKTFGKTS